MTLTQLRHRVQRHIALKGTELFGIPAYRAELKSVLESEGFGNDDDACDRVRIMGLPVHFLDEPHHRQHYSYLTED